MYIAELGYHRPHGAWVAISVSKPTLTPPDDLSEDTSVRFATIPIEVPFEKLIEAVKEVASVSPPLAEAIERLVEIGRSGRQQLGAKARQRIETEFSLSSIVQNYENLYLTICSNVCLNT